MNIIEIKKELILKLALKRIKDAFKESELNNIYINDTTILLELKSGRTFEIANKKVIYQAEEKLHEIINE